MFGTEQRMTTATRRHTLTLGRGKVEGERMISYSSTVSIARPPEMVFPFLVELEKQARWSDVQMRPLTAGPLATGSRMEVTFGRRPMKATIGLEMAAVEPGRRMAFRSFSGPIRWEGEYTVTPDGESGATVSQRGTLTFTGLWRAFEPLVGKEIRDGEVKELERLKVAVESEPQRADQPDS
jgi:hypothetical protein